MNPNAFNLRFRLGGIPVTILPWFWLTALLLGTDVVGPQIVFWVGLVLASVIVHEMGHALAFKLYNVPSTVELRAFGGVTKPSWRLPRWRALASTLAGPAAGLALAGASFGVMLFLGPVLPAQALWCASHLLGINVAWSILNLLPIPPLDGGHALLEIAGPRRRREAMYLGIGVGCLVTAYAVVRAQPFLALMLGFMVWENIQKMRVATA